MGEPEWQRLSGEEPQAEAGKAESPGVSSSLGSVLAAADWHRAHRILRSSLETVYGKLVERAKELR